MKNLSWWNQVEVFTLRFVEGVEGEEWRGTKSLWKLFGRCSSIEGFSKSEIKIWLLFKCWAGRKLGWLFAIGSFCFCFSLLTLACLSALLWAVFLFRLALLTCASWRACTWLTCRSTFRTCRLNPDCQVFHLLQRGKCLILCNPFDYITHVLCHVFTCFNRSFQPNPD